MKRTGIHANKRLTSSLICIILLLSFLLPLTKVMASPPSDAPDLFTDSAFQGDVETDDPTIIRTRFVDINFDLLGGVDGPPRSQSSSNVLRLNLFEGAVFTAVLDRLDSNWSGSYSWIGHLEGMEYSQVTLVFKGRVLVGNITLPEAFYQVRYVGSGVHAVHEIDQQAFPPEAEPILVDTSEGAPAKAFDVAADGCSIIDVMVVYTGAARTAQGGTTAMNNLIDLAVSETNTGYANSNVTQRINLVHTEEVTYNESGFSWTTILNHLTGKTDGYMDNVHTLRDTYGADLVVLIIDKTGYCGIAWLMDTLSPSFESHAFSVVARMCTTGYYSFAHETGHNMGSHHDRANAGGMHGCFSYSYGYQAPDEAFRTIMAYNCPGGCLRINHWSNPEVLYGGQPTGVVYTAPNSADNRRSLDNTACTVANWRTSVVTPTAPSGLTATAVSPNQINLSWTDNSYNEDGFKIERSPDGLSWTQIYTTGVDVTTHLDMGLTCSTPYSYHVRAYNANGDSDHSNIASATTPAIDNYEPDDTYTNAVSITVNGPTQHRNFHVASNDDWAKFAVTAGETYDITTSNLGDNTDTVLELYDTNGTTMLTSNNDCLDPGSGFASCIKDWEAPGSGTYFIKARQLDGAGGCTGYGYDLAVSSIKKVYLPLIFKQSTGS